MFPKQRTDLPGMLLTGRGHKNKEHRQCHPMVEGAFNVDDSENDTRNYYNYMQL